MKWVSRLLMAFGALIVIAVVCLLLLGMRKDANTLNTSVEIARPPAQVWPWITEPDKLKQWVGWVVEIRNVTPNQHGVGSKAVFVMEDRYNKNAHMEINDEVTAYEEGKFVEVKMDSPNAFDGRFSYTLVDLGNGRTRFESRGKYHYASAFARLMEPLITPQATKKTNEDLAALKKVVEAQPLAEAGAK